MMIGRFAEAVRILSSAEYAKRTINKILTPNPLHHYIQDDGGYESANTYGR